MINDETRNPDGWPSARQRGPRFSFRHWSFGFRHFPTLLLALALAAGAGAAEIRLRSAASTAYVGLPLTLRLEIIDARRHDAPQLPEVTNAEVQPRGQIYNGRQESAINGRVTVTQTVIYAWNLTPRAPGPVTVPGFRVRIDGIDQEVAGLTVDARVSDVGDRVAVEISADHAEVYVGQPLELTLDLFVKAFTDPRFSYTFSANDLFGLIDVGASRWGPFAATLNDNTQRGRQVTAEQVRRPDAEGNPADYFRYRISARVYPDRAGPLELDGEGVRIVGQYPVALRENRGFMGTNLAVSEAQPIAVSAPNPDVRVKPVPTAGRPDTYRGAVGRYRITAAADPLSVAAGDAVTLQLMVLGDGPLDRLSAPPLEAIAELTADFDVTPGPIAGVLRDGAKVFTTTIRPRRADVTEIPPIPLVSFDPETEAFVTSESEPIALAVRPADRLVLDGLTDEPKTAARPPSPAVTVAAEPDAPAWLPLPDAAADGPAWPWFWPMLYAAVPTAAGLGRAAWWGAGRLRGNTRAVAARAASRARRALGRVGDADGVANALRRYAADLTGQPAAALTAGDARAALAAGKTACPLPALDAFETALRNAEAAACGACPAPTDALSRAARAAVDGVATATRTATPARPAARAAAWLLLLTLTAPGGADTTPKPGDSTADHRAAAERFEQAPPGAAALTNAATAWNLAGEPARARAAGLAAVRFAPAASAARAALADAEDALGIAPSATAGFDRLTARWLGWGGRRLVMAAGLAGLLGAGLWWWIGRTRLGTEWWIRGPRPWKIAGGLALAAAGAGLALHTALTVPPAGTVVLLDPEATPRSGPGDGFAAAPGVDAPPHAGSRLGLIETRDGWVRTPGGWLPAAAVAPVDRTPRMPA